MHVQKVQQRDIDECIFAVAQGDDQALERLYNLTSSAVYAYALSVIKNADDARDVLHDTYIKVYESAHNYISHGKPMAWIFTIAKNLCYTVFRARTRFVDVPDEDIEGRYADDSVATADDKLVINQLLTVLSDDERQIVVMHAMSGLKHKDIARVLDMPLGSILSKYNRAIKKLQKAFEEG